MQLLSVIVPVYNVEKFINDCIDSILGQSYKNIELILVDDGSTDSSGEICDKYCSVDKRVKVIHQNNKGCSAARNAGIANAKGNLIAFMDADDLIDQDMYEVLIKNRERNHDGTVFSSSDVDVRREDRKQLEEDPMAKREDSILLFGKH